MSCYAASDTAVYLTVRWRRDVQLAHRVWERRAGKMDSKLTIIRDPVHNYIPISSLDKQIIDHPLFLRLRYITQNGLAHVV